MFMLFLFFVPAVYAAEAQQVEKGYTCLENKINQSKCSSFSTEEKIFLVLSTGECISELVESNISISNGMCWQEKGKSGCSTKLTAQAVFALNEKVDTTQAENWILTQSKIPDGIDWFLEIETLETGVATCTITYSESTYTVSVGADRKLSFSGAKPSTLVLAQNDYWLKISPSIYNTNLRISCNKNFLTTLLFMSKGSSTVHVSGTVSRVDRGKLTTERVESLCFTEVGSCNYEASLWAAFSLYTIGGYKEDILKFMPYLTTMMDDLANQKYLSESFLYFLTGKFRTELLTKQDAGLYWQESEDRYYDTALALWPLYYEDTDEKTNSISWLLDVQQNTGCWNAGNVRDTAFILYSVWPKDTTPVIPAGECDDYLDCWEESCSERSCTGGYCDWEPFGCENNDGCCNSGCTISNDNDCEPGENVCTSDSQCEGDNYDEEPYCSDDGDVYTQAHTFVCSSGVCTENVDEVRVQRCSSSEYCDLGECIPNGDGEENECGFLNPCPSSDQECIGNVCVDKEEPECYIDEDCLSGEICIDEFCESSCDCASDSDCPSDYICTDCMCIYEENKCGFLNPCEDDDYECINNVCVPKEVECYTNYDCPIGEECINEFCEKECDCISNYDCEIGFSCIDCACIFIDDGICESNFDCSANENCINGDCVPDECTVDGNCSTGEICADGECMPNGDECDDDYDCPIDKYCIDGDCLFPEDECTSNYNCSTNENCINGECVPDECITDNDCDTGEDCVNGECMPNGDECDDDYDCPVGQICTDGNCTVDYECTEDTDCASGSCINHECIPDECSTSYDCPLGKNCNDGMCEVNQEECDDDSDCSSGTCVNKECVPYECEDDYECDYGSCINNECIPYSCITDNDCLTEGEECVGGSCLPEETYDCEEENYFCMIEANCDNTGGLVLEDYTCVTEAFVCCDSEIPLKTCIDEGGDICSSEEECVGGTEPAVSNTAYGETCCVGGTCEEEKITETTCVSNGGTCSDSCGKCEEENTIYSCDSGTCCIEKDKCGGGAGKWILIIFLLLLIVLSVLGIVFRDKLRTQWIKLKDKLGGKKEKKKFEMPLTSHPTAQGRILPRRILPPGQSQQQNTGFPIRRPITSQSTQASQPITTRSSQSTQQPTKKLEEKPKGDLDEVLKKLKEMSK
jgi:hypothetical protein